MIECPIPRPQKHGNKGYFDQKYVLIIPNVTQIVQKAYIITNEVQKFKLLGD